MGFRADGAKAHGAGSEAFDDFASGLDGIKGDALCGVVKVQQPRSVACGYCRRSPALRKPSRRLHCCCVQRFADLPRILGPTYGCRRAVASGNRRVWQHADGGLIPLRIADEVTALHLFR